MTIIKMTDLDLKDQRLLIRQDLNVPMRDGVITSDLRIKASLATLQHCLDAGAKVMVFSHLGRPQEGQQDSKYSLKPVADHLGSLLGRPVPLIKDYLQHPIEMAESDIVLLENVRFNIGEKVNDENLSRRYATLCDIYVMDAFGTAHRAQASTSGAAHFAPKACAGPQLIGELNALTKALKHAQTPLVAIVGGAKVSTKLGVLHTLLEKVDLLIPGGGIANTFIAAQGYNIGQSLVETDLLSEAQSLLRETQKILMPTDVICAKALSAESVASTKPLDQLESDDRIFDIGPQTAAGFAAIMHSAATIIWNGPLGVFEFEQFASGTKTLSLAIARSKAFSIAGGGDTLAAIEQYDIGTQVSYISTGGGAFLEFLEGKTLPAIATLENRGKKL